MSDDYIHAGAVRRRPRVTHERSRPVDEEGHGGSAAGSGAFQGNGHSKFDSEQDSAGKRRDEKARTRKRERPRKALPYRGRAPEFEARFRLPFDPWRLYGAVSRNLVWVLLGGALAGVLGFFLAAYMIDYRVALRLMRKTPNAVAREGFADQLTAREYSDQTLYSFLKSGDVLRGVATKAATNVWLAPLKVTPEQLARAVQVHPSPNPDFIVLSIRAFGGLRAMVELINLYGREASAYTRDIQRREYLAMNELLKKHLSESAARTIELRRELRALSQGTFGDLEKETQADVAKYSDLQLRLDAKRIELEGVNQTLQAVLSEASSQAGASGELRKLQEDLERALVDKTELHPEVRNLRARIEKLRNNPNPPAAKPTNAFALNWSNPISARALELERARAASIAEIHSISNRLEEISRRLAGHQSNQDDIAYAVKKAELQSQEAARDLLAKRERETRLFAENTLGYFQVTEPAGMHGVDYKRRWLKVSLLALLAGTVGFLVSLAIVLLNEVLDTRLKTAEDLTRATGLPVLATLGNLRGMSPGAQVNWAFRTLTLLRGRLNRRSDQALVCGLISATHGEGRSTWVNLLVSAASQRGLRVLTVDTRPSSAAPTSSTPRPQPPPPAPTSEARKSGGEKIPRDGAIEPSPSAATPCTDVLAAPAKVTARFEDPNVQSIVHIPLPGWVWNLERRKQWQKALEQWKTIENLVIFVELPPASEAEAILLAEHLPQLIWLCGSGMADAAETKAHLETLRHARCNLVGAVLNCSPPPFLNARITRWFTQGAAVLLLCGGLRAAEPAPEAGGPQVAAPEEAADKPAFSAAATRKRAKWQERLTFGPGDVMDIHFYGKPALSRTNLFVGPDGRINYLEARGITAAGRTVEELREAIANALAPFYTAEKPAIIVQPVAFTSKKYYMLGKVNAKGAYILDRPLTLLEAVARAKGLETGLYQRTTVETADLGHSFVIRGGAKLPIDFEKLFLEGDLSQNVPIEPDDYIYFASASASDIYVLGEVMSPGPIGFLPNATVLSAITDRGGFADQAFKRRVLVVRGSLNEPETFVVDTGGVLEARVKDFKLQPKDIVYVSRRPWSKAEELLDEAAASFIQGAVTTWAGVNVGPIIKSRLLPRTRPR